MEQTGCGLSRTPKVGPDIGILPQPNAVWTEFLQENSTGISLAGNTAGKGCPMQEATGTDLPQVAHPRETLLRSGTDLGFLFFFF